MPDTPRPDSQEMARIARQHVDSLRAAGVEWVPAVPPRRARKLAESPSGTPSLFSGIAEPGAAAALTPDQRRHELEVLAQRVSTCPRCAELVATRRNTVFGTGRIEPDLCFVGEAPGADEDASGEPFVGPAGQLLNRIIAACGMKREEVYICNILKCRPPGNRQPLPHEVANCREYLEKQLELLRPRFLCALGLVAAQNLLGSTQSMARLRGQFHDYRGIPVMCTYHPAYLLRNPAAKKDVWEDMKKLLQRMGRPIR